MSFYGYLFIFFWLHLKKIQKAAFSSSAIASSGVHQPILATQCCAALSLVYMPTPPFRSDFTSHNSFSYHCIAQQLFAVVSGFLIFCLRGRLQSSKKLQKDKKNSCLLQVEPIYLG